MEPEYFHYILYTKDFIFPAYAPPTPSHFIILYMGPTYPPYLNTRADEITADLHTNVTNYFSDVANRRHLRPF